MNNLINYKLNDTVPFKTASRRCSLSSWRSTTTYFIYYCKLWIYRFRGFKTDGYAPITKDVTAHNQCGGKKKRRRKSRKSKKKSRKKRKSRKRRYKHKGGANCKCCKCFNKKSRNKRK